MYPDIAPVATDFSVIDRDVLEPVDEYLTREELEDYKVQALNAVRYKGKIWWFPWMMTTYTMLLNLDLFHEKGVDPPKDGNWTYDEFMETIEHLHLKLIGFMKIQNYNFLFINIKILFFKLYLYNTKNKNIFTNIYIMVYYIIVSRYKKRL
ncbi:type 2 periplasmic-binding domain-containing protein [Thermotalea metallivorans]|uniref:Uncharacterized protein n=1 Tax=Thermotalea metallivorans TaxID=520762 RepID=A0A140LC23_9FIRM|nr:extracellular solute-binding protein [Thermotalea metallivorans]KXG78098.1 hypothetical protein AN619_02860 [Thermotalea metallivorans]